MEKSIGPDEVKRRMDAGEGIFLLDVRQPEEFREWRIEGSRNIPLGELGGRIGEIPREKEIITICQHGMRSIRASQFLGEMGYKSRVMEGGMVEWNSVMDTCRIGEGIFQFRRVGKGCLSYMIVSGKEAAIIDPCMEAGFYLKEAERAGARIIAAMDTHIHADHVSGGEEISRISGAGYYLPGDSRRKHEKLAPGMEAGVGTESIRAVGTPGHTPEGLTFLFREFAFTGDTLFTDGFGRPDLGQDPRENSGILWDSINGVLFKLPDSTKILPAHTTGQPAPGNPVLEAIGTLKKRLAVTREEFSRKASERMQAPGNFEVIKRINLGLEDFYPEEIKELEAGPNRCAVVL